MSYVHEHEVPLPKAAAPICPYCGKLAWLASGRQLYPHRKDLSGKLFYRCAPCDAFVGCHPGTLQPLGTLANAELRRARMAAHQAFDPIWRGRARSRRSAYRWLAQQLGVAYEDCHIGMFDMGTCQRVIELCTLDDFEVLQ